MLSYRMTEQQDATWHQCGAAQAELEAAIAAILHAMTTQGVLVVSFMGLPLFYVQGGAA
jgi:hypothetical protein